MEQNTAKLPKLIQHIVPIASVKQIDCHFTKTDKIIAVMDCPPPYEYETGKFIYKAEIDIYELKGAAHTLVDRIQVDSPENSFAFIGTTTALLYANNGKLYRKPFGGKEKEIIIPNLAGIKGSPNQVSIKIFTLSEDGKLLVLAGENAIYIIDCDFNSETYKMKTSFSVRILRCFINEVSVPIAISKNNNMIAYLYQESTNIAFQTYAVSTGETTTYDLNKIFSSTSQLSATCVQFSEDGSRLYICGTGVKNGFGAVIFCLDLLTMKFIYNEVPSGWISCLIPTNNPGDIICGSLYGLVQQFKFKPEEKGIMDSEWWLPCPDGALTSYDVMGIAGNNETFCVGYSDHEGIAVYEKQ